MGDYPRGPDHGRNAGPDSCRTDAVLPACRTSPWPSIVGSDCGCTHAPKRVGLPVLVAIHRVRARVCSPVLMRIATAQPGGAFSEPRRRTPMGGKPLIFTEFLDKPLIFTQFSITNHSYTAFDSPLIFTQFSAVRLFLHNLGDELYFGQSFDPSFIEWAIWVIVV